MKKIIVLLAALAFAGTASADGHDGKVKITGNIDVDYHSFSNYNGDSDTGDYRAFFRQRSQVGLTFMKDESLSASFKLRTVGTWGDIDGYSTGGALQNGSTGSTEKSTNAVSNTVRVQEAQVKWAMNDMLSLNVGRGGYKVGYGDVISTNLWEDNPTLFDGALLLADFDFLSAGVFYVNALEENGVDNFNGTAIVDGDVDPDGYFTGVTIDVKNLPDFLDVANVHYIMASAEPNNANVASGTNLAFVERSWYGLAVGGENMGLDYKLAYEIFSGSADLLTSTTDFDLSGTMLDFGLGYTLENLANLRIGLQYHTDSGDDGTNANEDNTYDPFHYERHYRAGLMDVVRWGNLTYFALNVSASPWEGGTVGIDYYSFTKTEENGAASLNENYAAGTFTETAGEDGLGNEIDIHIEQKYDNGTYVRFEYGIFQFGDGLKKSATEDADDATRVYLAAGFEF